MSKSYITSIRLGGELNEQLQLAANKLNRGKNWIIVQALEEYLNKMDDADLIQQAREQSILASSYHTDDEDVWNENKDDSGWQYD